MIRPPVSPEEGVRQGDSYQEYLRQGEHMSDEEWDALGRSLEDEARTNRSPYNRTSQRLDGWRMADSGRNQRKVKEQRQRSYMARHKAGLRKLTINGQPLDLQAREHLGEFAINDIGATIIDAAIGERALSEAESAELREFVRVVRL